jgi:hypothetical protein
MIEFFKNGRLILKNIPKRLSKKDQIGFHPNHLGFNF